MIVKRIEGSSPSFMMKFDRFMSPKESHRPFDNGSMGEHPGLDCISSVIYPDGKLFDKLDVQFIPVIFRIDPSHFPH